ncbi:MAG: DUF11 domain-containing protein [Pseudomonadota bacterium]
MIALVRHFRAAIALALAAAVLLAPQTVHAQTAEIDWEDAGVSSLTPFPTGTSVNGSDGTTATVDWSVSANGSGSFVPAFGGEFVSYFSGTVGGNASPLIASFNNATYDPLDRITVTITLSRSVSNLQFALSDIDTADTTGANFRDAVEVLYDDDLTGGFTNAANTAAFWSTGSAVTRTNDGVLNGWRGTAGSATAAVDGNIDFDFGAQQVRRVRISYISYTDPTPGRNPTDQFLSISDFTFLERTADLSLTKQLLGSPPGNGGSATWQLTVTNDAASEIGANGIVVRDTFPAGFTFDSASGDGSFDDASGEWSVGTLAPGESASINIAGLVSASAGSTVTNTAEIIASSAPDPDSTVNNGVTSEDDFASSSYTVAADPPSNPPLLPCPVGEILFDWQSVNWPGGSLSNSYQLGSFGTIAFDIVTDGTFVSRGSFGGAVPRLTTAVSGGLTPAELSLAYNQNNTNTSQQAVTTVALPRVFTGVQFSVFDIDRSNTFQDRVTVYGLLNGVRVNAVLTSGPSNTVSGPSIIGTSGATDTTANGTGVFTFLDPIDTIIIEYGNGPGAPSNPTNQSIAIHDFTFCVPTAPVIGVSKVSSVISDPVNEMSNPKAIPGALIEYLITVTNSGSGATDADSVVVWDDGPADAKFCLLQQSGGPVTFTDPGSNSGLSYSFANLGSSADDLEFSNNDGASFGYTPSADSDGCDSAITDFRVRPSGALAPGGDFTLRVRYIVE